MLLVYNTYSYTVKAPSLSNSNALMRWQSSIEHGEIEWQPVGLMEVGLATLMTWTLRELGANAPAPHID